MFQQLDPSVRSTLNRSPLPLYIGNTTLDFRSSGMHPLSQYRYINPISANLSHSYPPQFQIFCRSSHLLSLKLSHSKLSVFNIYRPPSSSTHSKPFSVFLVDFGSFLSFAAITTHEFIITSDFNIHLDNPADTLTSQFLSLLSSFNLSQHVHFPTHDKNHTLDLVITSSDTSLAPAVSCTHWSPSDHCLSLPTL